jgi:hypothetical protein
MTSGPLPWSIHYDREDIPILLARTSPVHYLCGYDDHDGQPCAGRYDSDYYAIYDHTLNDVPAFVATRQVITHHGYVPEDDTFDWSINSEESPAYPSLLDALTAAQSHFDGSPWPEPASNPEPDGGLIV